MGDQAPPRSAWPTVIGVLCLLYALLGLVSNGCGLFWQQSQRVIFSMSGIRDVEIPSDIAMVSLVVSIIGMALVILLFVGAVGLMRRKQASLKLLRIWVVLQVVLALAGVVAGVLMIDSNIKYQEQISDAVREMMVDRGENADAFPRQSEEEMRRGAVIGLIVGTPMQMAFPVVIGLLLTRRRWREEAEGWDEAVA